ADTPLSIALVEFAPANRKSGVRRNPCARNCAKCVFIAVRYISRILTSPTSIWKIPRHPSVWLDPLRNEIIVYTSQLSLKVIAQGGKLVPNGIEWGGSVPFQANRKRTICKPQV